ncbi:MAG: bifunctional pyr operon transcriptional regulator/uracil phosphoribosyltransferase PyrR [Candidatus Altiarchaeales archaeon]|nr:bifunctional pyr operon transcriptional regulator/uracil phosphoribosyltransferase PyrR [Candidatus Altiarchaeales archaeon]MBD3417029.1 bifunctional pyr operon transcriptional regulator/uracil phosphoribosyltransferase PyrR [Candidatus Altiarchaeales archaeon]
MNTAQIMGEDEVKEAEDKLLEQILEGENPEDLVLVGIITRGVTLAKRLKNRIKKESGNNVGVGSLDTRPYRDDVTEDLEEDLTDIPFDINGRNVVLVDDVMSTGRTIRAAMDALTQVGRPKSIKTAVLVDRGHRELPITADYVGSVVLTSVKEKIKIKLREVDGGRDRAIISAE